MSTPTEQTLSRICADAALAGMRVLRPSQAGRVGLRVTGRKDSPPMTATAHLDSQQAMLAVLQKRLPGVPIISKCTASTAKDAIENYAGACIIVIDPAAGALSMIMGSPSFNVAVGIYSVQLRRLIAGAIGCPATGLLYFAGANTGTFVEQYDPFIWKQIDDGRSGTCHTWQGNLDSKCAIFLDSTRGFTRTNHLHGDRRQVLNYDQMCRLVNELSRVGHLHMYGSTAEHQRLVTAGYEYVGVSFTTAISGPWDQVGTLLVVEAGGAAIGLVIESDDGRQYVAQVDELDALRCDIVITANTQATLDGFVSVLQRAVDPGH